MHHEEVREGLAKGRGVLGLLGGGKGQLLVDLSDGPRQVFMSSVTRAGHRGKIKGGRQPRALLTLTPKHASIQVEVAQRSPCPAQVRPASGSHALDEAFKGWPQPATRRVLDGHRHVMLVSPHNDLQREAIQAASSTNTFSGGSRKTRLSQRMNSIT